MGIDFISFLKICVSGCKGSKKLTIFAHKILKIYFHNEINILYFYFDVFIYSL